ncbi:ATP-binding Cassette (ABC) Superfamily [Phytophthora nicotianae]|nr:ATP-binding Cassette (ABC) Superfamily [Phytophthora nicotianae]
MRSVEHAVLNGTTKWKTAMDIAGGVVEAMSSHGTRTFLRMTEVFREFGECVREGVVPTLMKPQTTSVESLLRAPSGDFYVQHDTELADSDSSSVPPTHEATNTAQSNTTVDGFNVESDCGDSINGESEQLPDECDRLLAETNRIITRVRDMVSSDSDNDDTELFELVQPGNKNTPTSRTLKSAKIQETNQSVVITKQSGTATNQLKTSTIQSVSCAVQKPSNTFDLVDKAAASELSQSVNDTTSLAEKSVPLVDTTNAEPNHSVDDGNQSVRSSNQSVRAGREFADQPTEATCQLVLRKRRSKERGDSSPGDSFSHEGISGEFRVSTSVKSKGRPKIRRKQAREAKKLRMDESIAEAKALVQGTLVPEKDLALVRKTLACSFNVEDALPVLHSIAKVDAPTWKATSIVQLARKQKVHKKVTIVFPKNYVTKCIAGINMYRKSFPSDDEAGRMGVSIKKLGTFTEKDLITMRDWHDESPKFDAFCDLAAWIRVSRFARITLPSPLNNCVTVDLQACAKRLETVNLKTTMDTRFGQVGIEEMAFFRRSEWLDDSCMKLVMSHLMDQDQDENKRSCIGAVNPLYARVHDEAMKLQVIGSSPLRSSNRMILVPVYLDGHWAGVVFDNAKSRAVVFDPMQTNKYYNQACTVIKKYFGNYSSNLKLVRQHAPRQKDTNSCGPLVLLFFECMVRGMAVPNVAREQLAYLRFRYLFLTSKGVFCRSPDTATSEE